MTRKEMQEKIVNENIFAVDGSTSKTAVPLGFDASKQRLQDLRFDTAQSSDLFLKLRYLDRSYEGHSHDGIKLPPLTESVSRTPSSGSMVYKAFQDGLMYGDQMALMNGLGIFVAIMVALPFVASSFLTSESLVAKAAAMLQSDDGFIWGMTVLLSIVFLVLIPIGVMTLFDDLIGFRFDTSPLFDRKAQKVHIFTSRSLPWTPWRYVVTSYDWACVRAEIDTLSSFTGGILMKEAGLRCVVTDQPGGSTVVDQFVLGAMTPAQHIQPLLDTWEHLRRFMQGEGALFADDNDGPNPALGRQSLWKHLIAWPKEQIAITIDMYQIAWKTRSLHAAVAALGGTCAFAILWVPMLWGFLPWICGLVKREPIWPDHILNGVGGKALTGQELDAWRNVIPEPVPRQDI